MNSTYSVNKPFKALFTFCRRRHHILVGHYRRVIISKLTILFQVFFFISLVVVEHYAR